MANCTRRHPHEALLDIPPPAPIQPSAELFGAGMQEPIAAAAAEPGDYFYPRRLRLAEIAQKTLRSSVYSLSYLLRQYYHQRILWPRELQDECPVTDMHEYYREVLVAPIASLFSQLRSPDVEFGIDCELKDLHSGLCQVRFYSGESPAADLLPRAPVVLFMSGDLFTQYCPASAYACNLLQSIWGTTRSRRIISTDLSSVVIFHPPTSPGSDEALYECYDLAGNLARFRIIVAAYLYRDMGYMVSEYWDPSIYPWKEQYVYRPLGPGNNPFAAILESDKLIFPTQRRHSGFDLPSILCNFSTWRRHSDFDLPTILRNPDRAFEFLKWKHYMNIYEFPRAARLYTTGTVVRGITRGFNLRYTPLMPRYVPDPFSTSTAQHIDAIQRPCSLGRLFDPFRSSQEFCLVLLSELGVAPMPSPTMCKTFTCRLSSIDGSHLDEHDSPILCVKFFDDRFYQMDIPEEITGELDSSVPYEVGDSLFLPPRPPKLFAEAGVGWWFRHYRQMEDFIRNEEAAYKTLECVQGSLIPRYYGAHTFTLPDGHEVYGILMEYVPARPLNSGICRKLTLSQQIQLVKSVRHAVHVLQCMDVSQHTWHPGHILCNVQNTSFAHCILVDFSSTTQTLASPMDLHRNEDANFALWTLLGRSVGLNVDLVFDHYTGKEAWDLTTVGQFRDSGVNRRLSRPGDPFEFVYRDFDPDTYIPHGIP